MARKTELVKISDITKFGDVLARSIRGNLGWSKKLRGQVRLKKAKKSGEITSIQITVAEGNDDLTGMALAYEHGSGLRGKNRSKYLIKPKTKKALWFYLDNPYPNVPIYIKPSGEIGVTVQKVMHPGVAPRPFISKAIASTLKRATDDLRVSITKNVKDQIRLTLKDLSK